MWPTLASLKETTFLICLLPSIPTTASIYLLIIPLIWQSFSCCCCRSLLSLSSSRFWYCRRILLVCCSCVRSLRSYSSSFLWDITRRSFRELISSSYSRTWGRDIKRKHKISNVYTGWLFTSLGSFIRLPSTNTEAQWLYQTLQKISEHLADGCCFPHSDLCTSVLRPDLSTICLAMTDMAQSLGIWENMNELTVWNF